MCVYVGQPNQVIALLNFSSYPFYWYICVLSNASCQQHTLVWSIYSETNYSVSRHKFFLYICVSVFIYTNACIICELLAHNWANIRNLHRQSYSLPLYTQHHECDTNNINRNKTYCTVDQMMRRRNFFHLLRDLCASFHITINFRFEAAWHVYLVHVFRTHTPFACYTNSSFDF